MQLPWRLWSVAAWVLLAVLGPPLQGQSFPAIRHKATDLLRLEMSLRGSVRHLAGVIGERNVDHPEKLAAAADWIAAQWKAQGLSSRRYRYAVGKVPCENIDVHVAGPERGPVIVVGAHYDSVRGCPGADDNASGVAVMLELSRALARAAVGVGVRCVAFTNEEPPYFMSDLMGSRVYARMIRARGDEVKAMLSLETLGYYRSTEGSQRYPPLLSAMYPSAGNFVAVVGDLSNATSVNEIGSLLRKAQSVPVETASFPGDLPGISWSDHASFWQAGYPGVMITDTAPYRNPNYHLRTDTAETLDYQRLACVTAGLIDLVRGLAKVR